MHMYVTGQEQVVNSLGYNFLGQKNFTLALVLFRLNARTHPNSANAFDSLGEAEEDAQMVDGAEAAYRRSLELSPENQHARDALARLSKMKS